MNSFLGTSSSTSTSPGQRTCVGIRTSWAPPQVPHLPVPLYQRLGGATFSTGNPTSTCHTLSPTPSHTRSCRSAGPFSTGWYSSSDKAWRIYSFDCSYWTGRPLHSSISSPPSGEQQSKQSTLTQRLSVGTNRRFQQKVATWGRPCTWTGRLQQQWAYMRPTQGATRFRTLDWTGVIRRPTRKRNGEEHLSKRSPGTRQPTPPVEVISQMYDHYWDSTHAFSLLLSAPCTVLLVL
jgi:hypothetical protein